MGEVSGETTFELFYFYIIRLCISVVQKRHNSCFPVPNIAMVLTVIDCEENQASNQESNDLVYSKIYVHNKKLFLHLDCKPWTTPLNFFVCFFPQLNGTL